MCKQYTLKELYGKFRDALISITYLSKILLITSAIRPWKFSIITHTTILPKRLELIMNLIKFSKFIINISQLNWHHESILSLLTIILMFVSDQITPRILLSNISTVYCIIQEMFMMKIMSILYAFFYKLW